MPKLENLEVPWNDFGPDGANALARSIASCSMLTSLNLCECNLQAEGGSHFAKSLIQVLCVRMYVCEKICVCVCVCVCVCFPINMHE